MMRVASRAVLVIAFLFGCTAVANAARTVVPKGTEVMLVFDQAVSSKTAKPGQAVKLHVKDDVMVNRTVVVKAGTEVKGVISRVEKRKRYGVNATLRMVFNPVKTGFGTTLPIQPRTQGGAIGRKTAGAAAATAGGAVVLGPVGLVGGYFISGKTLNVKPGETIATEVSKRTLVGRTEPTARKRKSR